jgi:hypothetical protein
MTVWLKTKPRPQARSRRDPRACGGRHQPERTSFDVKSSRSRPAFTAGVYERSAGSLCTRRKNAKKRRPRLFYKTKPIASHRPARATAGIEFVEVEQDRRRRSIRKPRRSGRK